MDFLDINALCVNYNQHNHTTSALKDVSLTLPQ
ncbi:hypothetical protein SDC9_188631 [bioreactor metagenome]|uniref:Uncharacterized protein n=1 Tax=bioreactor metagenome TaxID=1076179 RepID=A0A645HQF1_9ZZZZ